MHTVSISVLLMQLPKEANGALYTLKRSICSAQLTACTAHSLCNLRNNCNTLRHHYKLVLRANLVVEPWVSATASTD